jgi:hypothetical protein
MAGPASEASAAAAAASYELSKQELGAEQSAANRRQSYQAAATAFVVLFCIVGIALWGLPFYYDFMVQQFGWTRAQVTSGNALSKLVVGPIFGFLAGWVVDRFGPRRLMMLVHRTVSSLHYAGGLSVALSAWDGLPDTAWWLR